MKSDESNMMRYPSLSNRRLQIKSGVNNLKSFDHEKINE